MIADLLATLGYFGVGGVLFLAFIILCLVKGGRSKKSDNGVSNTSNVNQSEDKS